MKKILLELEGYQVMALNDGHELSVAIAHCRPDVIIMDVMLGDLDGRKLCEGMKEDLLTSTIPIIIIPASHDLKIGSMTEACRPNHFLAKPFDIYCLIEKVQFQLAG